MKFFEKLFGKKADYEAQKKALASGDAARWKQLARDKSTSPEILYYLAQAGDTDIKQALILNPSTPPQAATLLAQDHSSDIRMALAARVVELMPSLSADKHSQLYSYAVQALGMLAQDEVFLIRKALSAALKDDAKAPPSVVSRLARDVEREVSEPILRYCAAVSDDDLLDILSHHPEPWVISSIANRKRISAVVSEAVVDTEDVPAITALVSNSGASFAAPTLQKIIDKARDYPAWHRPIALRRELSLELAHELAGIVDGAVLKILEERSDFDPATRKNIVNLVRRRLEYKHEEDPEETPITRLERFVSEGKLTQDVIYDALTWHDVEFVLLAIAYLAKVPPQVVQKIFDLHAPKPVVAICLRAKLPMRLCVDIQRLAAKVPLKDLIYAKGGTDYPMDEKEAAWQLEFFGVS